MPTVFFSIGSNIEPAVNFKRCAIALAHHFHSPVWSPVYRSTAVGMVGDDFLNAVVMVDCTQSIESIILLLKQIEDEQGRVRSANKFSDRTLDIDLLLYGNTEFESAELILPRPEITTAAYVLKPLADIAPNTLHLGNGKTYQQLWAELEQSSTYSQLNLHEVQLNLSA